MAPTPFGQLPLAVAAFLADFSDHYQHHGPNPGPSCDPATCHVCLAHHHFPALAKSRIMWKQVVLNGIPAQGLICCMISGVFSLSGLWFLSVSNWGAGLVCP